MKHLLPAVIVSKVLQQFYVLYVYTKQLQFVLLHANCSMCNIFMCDFAIVHRLNVSCTVHRDTSQTFHRAS